MARIFYASVLCAFTAYAQIPSPPTVPITETVQIAQFGAKGDGKTDDTKAFISAIAAKKRIKLDSRTYLLSSTLRVSGKSIVIEGTGNATLLFSSKSPQDGIVISGSPGAEIKSLAIRGTGKSLVHAISVSGSQRIVLDGLKISGVHGDNSLHPSGIFLNDVDGIWISNSSFTDIGVGSDTPSFAIWNYYKTHSQHVYIDHNQISGNTANIAIGLFDTNHSIVTDNSVDGGNNCLQKCINSGYGILFYRSEYNKLAPDEGPKLTDETITGNSVTNTAGSGIYLQGVVDSKVTNNTLTNTTIRFNDVSLAASAIALSYADNIQVLNNIVRGDAKGGICLAYTKDITIEGNQIHNAAKWDVRFRVAQANTTVINNTFDSSPRILLQGNPVGTRLH